jgi:hypothetical protein
MFLVIFEVLPRKEGCRSCGFQECSSVHFIYLSAVPETQRLKSRADVVLSAWIFLSDTL